VCWVVWIAGLKFYVLLLDVNDDSWKKEFSRRCGGFGLKGVRVAAEMVVVVLELVVHVAPAFPRGVTGAVAGAFGGYGVAREWGLLVTGLKWCLA